MKLRREAALGFAALLVVQVSSSGLAIALLARMGPAVGQILQENVYSIEAVEDMLTELAIHAERTDTITETFVNALERARSNVTEDAEVPLLEQIEADKDEAFGDDPEARGRVVASLRELGRVNRASMQRADARARSLSLAGAWAASMLAGLAFALGIVAYRRLRLRLELPIVALRDTLRRVRAGSWQARCPPVDAPREVEQIARDINWVLDLGGTRATKRPHPRISSGGPGTRA